MSFRQNYNAIETPEPFNIEQPAAPVIEQTSVVLPKDEDRDPHALAVVERQFERIPLTSLAKWPPVFSRTCHPRPRATVVITTGSPRGFPGPVGQDVYVGLAHLLNEQRMGRRSSPHAAPHIVETTFAELCDLMEITRSGKRYALLRDEFEDWSALLIKGTNFFRGGPWDKHRVVHTNVVTIGFTNPRGADHADTGVVAKFNEDLYASIDDEGGRPVTLWKYLTLKLPSARRLFRYLDVRRYIGRVPGLDLELSVGELCEHLPLVTPDPIHVVRNLTKAHHQLANLGFLIGPPRIEGRGQTTRLFYEFLPAAAPRMEKPWREENSDDAKRELVQDLVTKFAAEQNRARYTQLANRLPFDRIRAARDDALRQMNEFGYRKDKARGFFDKYCQDAAKQLGIEL